MPVIIDIVIVAVLAVFLIVGMKKGFVQMLLPLLAIAVAILLGLALRGPVRSLLDKTSMEEKITDSASKLVQLALDKYDTDNEEVAQEEGEKAVSSTSIPGYLVEKLKAWAAKDADNVYGQDADTARIIGAKLASLAMDLIAILIVVVIAIIVILIIKAIVKKTRQLNIPVLHQLDTVGGAIFGFVLGAAILYGIAFMVGLLASCGYLTGFAEAMKKSMLGGFLYNHNLLGKLASLFK